jgi:hypothetical protein
MLTEHPSPTGLAGPQVSIAPVLGASSSLLISAGQHCLVSSCLFSSSFFYTRTHTWSWLPCSKTLIRRQLFHLFSFIVLIYAIWLFWFLTFDEVKRSIITPPTAYMELFSVCMYRPCAQIKGQIEQRVVHTFKYTTSYPWWHGTFFPKGKHRNV